MNDRSKTCALATCGSSPNVISLPASAAGPTRSRSPDGRNTALSGRVLAPASPSAPRASSKARPTKDTCGLKCSDSSKNPNLNEFLANRLKQRFGSAGSMEYSQTWKAKVTPAGRQYWAHTASGRRTSGNESTGWPTPNTPSGGPNVKPTATHIGGMDLEGAATLAGWPTPMAGSPGTESYNPAGNTDSSRRTVALTAGWATPTQRDHKDGASTLENTPINGLLGRQVSLSLVPTEKRGALNPEFSLWLMGFPIEWASCGARVTRSSRKSRRSSSLPHPRQAKTLLQV